MKVCIITINDHINIGNRLQNYAVQELLKDRGFEVSTLIYESYDGEASKLYKLKAYIKNLLVKANVFTSDFYIKSVKKSPKMLLVKEFNKKHIVSTKKYFFKSSDMAKYKDDFDYYCAGSDQIWNAALVQNRDFFFMQFAPSEKTFSFSASMGTTYINEKYLDNYRRGFEHVGNISVRETSVRELIKKMVGKDATVLSDPTLLIDKNKWLSVAEKPKIELPEKYLVTYFLSAPTDSQNSYIEKYAKEHGLAVIDINQNYYDHVGPLEFLYLIANSEFVFTDSFHGTAFSIIFEKDFLVFQRNNVYDMSSRITTILEKFKLENRFFNGDNNRIDESLLELITDIKNQNTEHTNAIIESEKHIANDFLNKVFVKKD